MLGFSGGCCCRTAAPVAPVAPCVGVGGWCRNYCNCNFDSYCFRSNLLKNFFK